MFGTMGVSELVLILVIVLIIFGAGRLPQIGEGVGKALKGFRKEVHEIPQPASGEVQQETRQPQPIHTPTNVSTTVPPPATGSSPTTQPNTPYVPGPELTPGTTASMLYNVTPPTPQTSAASPNQPPAPTSDRVPSMEERAAAPIPIARGSYPPLPSGSQAKLAAKRPSAIVNRDAVARVQMQQAALKAKAVQSTAGVSPDDLQRLGEGIGEVVRTFRQAATDVQTSIDPQLRTIQAEMDAAQKEIQQSIESTKELPPTQEDSQKSA
ncbi:MAG TPA: twin-arginine translocase TatA/TatE family subunit [Nitrospira sp.]|jgi:TatA/E family protein of Tat protein translocase|nr:twin-arginine translocase TatA/TatE family subunit [Nitrospira sp.]